MFITLNRNKIIIIPNQNKIISILNRNKIIIIWNQNKIIIISNQNNIIIISNQNNHYYYIEPKQPYYFIKPKIIYIILNQIKIIIILNQIKMISISNYIKIIKSNKIKYNVSNMNESYLLYISSRPFVFSLSAIGTEVTAATRTRRRNQETARLPTSLTGGAVALNDPAAHGKTTVSATARRIHTVAATAITEDKTLCTSLVTTKDSTEIK